MPTTTAGNEPRAQQSKSQTSEQLWGRAGILLLLLVVAALALRLDGLSRRTFGHPENFAPGLNVPDWVRYPPPRHDLKGIYEGTLIDGHPPGYFVAMLPWVKAFGTSLFALRLPSALLGALSVFLLYKYARREADRTTAFLAAAFLALNGHHIFWSQMARMYVPVAALGIGSCLLLWKMLEDGRARYHIAYFVTTAAMLWTQLYCWPLLLAQMIWATLYCLRSGRRPVALTAQIAAVIAGSPVIQLSMYQNPPTQWRQSAFEYFGFGYLYYSESLFFGPRHPFAVLSIPLSVLGVILIAASLRARTNQPALANTETARGNRERAAVLLIAAAATALMVAFPLYAPPGKAGRTQLLAVAALPMMLVAGLELMHALLPRLAPKLGFLRKPWLPGPLSLWLALLPWAIMFTLSAMRPSFVARGALIFVPFLLLVLARAVTSLARGRSVAALAATALIVLHIGSVIYFRKVESSGRDYRTLAEQMRNNIEGADVILMRNRFSEPPLLYYMPEFLDQFMPFEALRNKPLEANRRVWVVEFSERPDSALFHAVQGRRELTSIQIYGGRAVLFAAAN